MTDIATLARAANLDLPPIAKKKLDAAAEQKLLDAIAKAGDPAAAREAYGKWLAEQGDAAGVLAVVGHARVAMKKRETELLEKHGDVLLGPLAKYIEQKWLDPTWERGFIASAEVNIERTLGLDNTEIFRTIITHPSARLMRYLRLGANRTERDFNDDFQPLIDTLVRERKPLALRELDVSGVFGSPCGDVSAIWEALPQLKEFGAFGSSITLGNIIAPNLEAIRVTLMSLDETVLEPIAQAQTPKLKTLILGGLEAKDAAAFVPVAEKAFPALATLCFDGLGGKADPVVDVVLKSPLAKRLTQFSLWRCTLSKAAKDRLKKRFPDALG